MRGRRTWQLQVSEGEANQFFIIKGLWYFWGKVIIFVMTSVCLYLDVQELMPSLIWLNYVVSTGLLSVGFGQQLLLACYVCVRGKIKWFFWQGLTVQRCCYSSSIVSNLLDFLIFSCGWSLCCDVLVEGKAAAPLRFCVLPKDTSDMWTVGDQIWTTNPSIINSQLAPPTEPQLVYVCMYWSMPWC